MRFTNNILKFLAAFQYIKFYFTLSYMENYYRQSFTVILTSSPNWIKDTRFLT